MRRTQSRRVAALVVISGLVVAAAWTVAVATTRHTAPGHGVRIPSDASAAPTSPESTPSRRPRSPLVADWVVQENAKRGTSVWAISRLGAEHDIEGFADRVSAQRGDDVTLYVSTTAPRFRVEAYRMGYYQGLGGRLVWTSADIGGRPQPAPTFTPGINMVECHWQPSLRVPIDASWPPGTYLLKLLASTGAQRDVPLTVRDDMSSAAFVIQDSVATWQAYNNWGGYDLYGGGPHGQFRQRSRIVSFDRPYAHDGSGEFPANELPLIWFAESKGLDVTYWSDVDLDREPELVLQHRALLTLGHDEYWSTAMRYGAQRARDAGVNLVFFGANALFRHIRYANSPLGPSRHIVDYKSAIEDPLAREPGQATVNWRDPPLRDPENTLLGEEYECNPVHVDMVVTDATSWVWAGAGVQDGQRLSGLVGGEYDHYNPQLPGPSPVEVLAHSPLSCEGRHTSADMTYYTAASGAGVIDTGTNYWIANLTGPCPWGNCRHNDTVVQATWNILQAFGAGPAADKQPSTKAVGP